MMKKVIFLIALSSYTTTIFANTPISFVDYPETLHKQDSNQKINQVISEFPNSTQQTESNHNMTIQNISNPIQQDFSNTPVIIVNSSEIPQQQDSNQLVNQKLNQIVSEFPNSTQQLDSNNNISNSIPQDKENIISNHDKIIDITQQTPSHNQLDNPKAEEKKQKSKGLVSNTLGYQSIPFTYKEPEKNNIYIPLYRYKLK